MSPAPEGKGRRVESAARGALAIVLGGIALGLVFNGMGRTGRPPRGLEWIARPAVLPTLEGSGGPPVEPSPPADAGSRPGPSGETAGPQGDLPEIPELDQPIQAQLPTVKRLFDAKAALFVDAREPEDYRAGHLPGSINLPFDKSVADPETVEKADTGGRPVVVYCEGFPCEVSTQVAWAFVQAGHRRVLVYTGGFGEWAGAGYPVARGGGSAEGANR